MSAGVIHVVRPGMQTTVQDLGRWGFQAQGVPVAGPMDPFSHRLANGLVGNDRKAATFEVTLVGPELEFEGDCVVALTGGEFAVTIDGRPVPFGQAVIVPSHARLRFGQRVRGARAYLAVAGGFDTPLVLGSRATHVPGAMGGWNGKPLQKGDRIPVCQDARRPNQPPRQSAHTHDMADEPAVVRALPGPDADRFAAGAMEALQSASYVIGGDSDRMGFRLRGPELRHAQGADIISDVTPTGTVQVPGSGQPILLMADRQTAGGYPRIATVISADLGIAGQRAPGDALTFRICSPAQALAALIARETALLAVEGGS